MTFSIIRLQVSGQPAPQGSKRYVGKGRMVEMSKKVRPWRDAVCMAASSAMHEAGISTSLAVPIALQIVFLMPRPKCHYGKGTHAGMVKASAPRVPASAPDLDKLVRSTCDALTDAGIWKDDSQVVSLYAMKVFAPKPGARIIIDEFNTSDGDSLC